LLWPDLNRSAASNNLHVTVHQLRRTLEPSVSNGRDSKFVRLEADLLRLCSPRSLWVDVEAFELACELAQQGTHTDAYASAAALYTGDLLPEDLYADWASTRRDALHSIFIDLLLRLAALYERKGELWPAAQTVERVIKMEPAHEQAVVRSMRLYMRLGERHRALEHFRRLERALALELDIGPSEEARWLRDEILQSAVPQRSVRTPLLGNRPLTSRERQISQMVASGLTNQRIASALGLSARTAETHVGRILRKLGVSSREQVTLIVRTDANADTHVNRQFQLSVS
jgi:DNA-binding SARP family transcriptional activator